MTFSNRQIPKAWVQQSWDYLWDYVDPVLSVPVRYPSLTILYLVHVITLRFTYRTGEDYALLDKDKSESDGVGDQSH